ncbi:MAG: FkbM family methyltransferase [Chitinophagaceae bacterium]
MDVGANEGKVLMLMHKVAPLAKHIAFEPIPVLYNQLYKKYNHIAQVFEVALSNRKGISTFNCVLTNMAYSGLLKRPYDRVEEDTQHRGTNQFIGCLYCCYKQYTIN